MVESRLSSDLEEELVVPNRGSLEAVVLDALDVPDRPLREL